MDEIRFHQGSLWNFKKMFVDSMDLSFSPIPTKSNPLEAIYCVFIEMKVQLDDFSLEHKLYHHLTFFNQQESKYFDMEISLFSWGEKASFIELINDNPDGKLFIYKETIKSDNGTSFT